MIRKYHLKKQTSKKSKPTQNRFISALPYVIMVFMKKSIIYIKYGLCLLAALIWGLAFVAQSSGAELLPPFAFTGIRSVIGSFALLVFVLIRDGVNKSLQIKKGIYQKKILSRKEKLYLYCGAAALGVLLFTATNLQQAGLSYTSAGKAGFITALYIVLVPVFSLFLKKKCPPAVWIAVVIALSGLFFLCVEKGEGLSVGKGEIMVLLCAVAFSFQIIVIDIVAPYTDVVKLSCLQFFVCGILSLVCMAIWEKPLWENVIACKWELLYVGIFSTAIAYTLQIFGQKGTNSTIASLLYSLESTFAVLGGAVILHQKLSAREWIGCALMVAAILTIEIPDVIKSLRGKTNDKSIS